MSIVKHSFDIHVGFKKTQFKTGNHIGLWKLIPYKSGIIRISRKKYPVIFPNKLHDKEFKFIMAALGFIKINV
jgi:hypothetical protein